MSPPKVTGTNFRSLFIIPRKEKWLQISGGQSLPHWLSQATGKVFSWCHICVVSQCVIPDVNTCQSRSPHTFIQASHSCIQLHQSFFQLLHSFNLLRHSFSHPAILSNDPNSLSFFQLSSLIHLATSLVNPAVITIPTYYLIHSSNYYSFFKLSSFIHPATSLIYPITSLIHTATSLIHCYLNHS